MCGICGLFGAADYVDAKRIRRMTSALAHRGPDQEAFYYSPNLAIGFRRLSIVALTDGRQPITNESKNVHIIFNGEIYNYRELRRELEEKGHVLRHQGDGEVLPHLYEEYGLTFPAKLRGTFAIAIWDERRRRLMLVRDRLGVKPLYVRHGEELKGVAFASEIKALLPGEEPPALDVQALDNYLSYRYVPAPFTIFKGIYKLPPGSALIISLPNQRVQLRSHYYWQPPEGQAALSFGEAAQTVRESLTEALKIRWPEEVPAGYFFSGGLDSAGLVALHNVLHPEPVRTYAIGFEQPKHTRDFRYYSELDQARYAAGLLKTRHRECRVSLTDVQQNLTGILTALDEPIADPTAIPLYFLAEFAAAQGEKVVLSGEGADELFGGYTTYLEPANYRRYQNLPGWLRTLAARVFPRQTERFSLTLKDRYFGVGGLLRPHQKQELYSLSMRAALNSESDYFPARFFLDSERFGEEERMLRFDLMSWLPENTLMKSDKMTMQHGLEIRLPYLDHLLVELGVSLPLAYKVQPKISKAVLRKALEQDLLKEIAQRPKNGFPVPITAWLTEELRREMQNVLLDPKSKIREYILPQKLEALFGQKVTSRLARLIWALYTLEIYLTFTLHSLEEPLMSVDRRVQVQEHRRFRLGTI